MKKQKLILFTTLGERWYAGDQQNGEENREGEGREVQENGGRKGKSGSGYLVGRKHTQPIFQDRDRPGGRKKGQGQKSRKKVPLHAN